MKDSIFDALRKAEDCLESAEYNLAGGFLNAAVNRAYYGVYDALTALLISKSLNAKSHSGAHNQFAEHFIKTREFSKEGGSIVKYCFDIRHQSDYDLQSNIDDDEAKKCVENCREFINMTKDYLEIQ